MATIAIFGGTGYAGGAIRDEADGRVARKRHDGFGRATIVRQWAKILGRRRRAHAVSAWEEQAGVVI